MQQSHGLLVIAKLLVYICVAYRSDKFIVGLTNVSPSVTAPTLWNYTVCGQYPRAVAEGATVHLQCTSNTCITNLTFISPAV